MDEKELMDMSRQELTPLVVEEIASGELIPADEDPDEFVKKNYDVDGIIDDLLDYIDNPPAYVDEITTIDDIDPDDFRQIQDNNKKTGSVSASVNKKAEEDIVNSYGVHFSPDQWDAIAMLMDDDLREEIHSYADDNMTKQQFFDAYARAHEDKYGEEWVLDTPHPQW